MPITPVTPRVITRDIITTTTEQVVYDALWLSSLTVNSTPAATQQHADDLIRQSKYSRWDEVTEINQNESPYCDKWVFHAQA